MAVMTINVTRTPQVTPAIGNAECEGGDVGVGEIVDDSTVTSVPDFSISERSFI